MQEVPSPCMKICRHDSNGVCFGCQRTKEEIGNWFRYSNEEKREVIKKASRRSNAPGEGGNVFLR